MYISATNERVWPGKHNPKLLSQFVNLHFGGDWSAYTHFGHWANNKRLTTSNAILLDDWLSLKADGTEYALTTSMLGVKRSDGNQLDLQTTLAKLSTKTARPLIASPPPTADGSNAIYGLRSPVQADIRSMFPVRRTPTSEEISAFKIADAIIEQQEVDDAARVSRMKARADKYAAAAKLKVATEKGVTWTIQPPTGIETNLTEDSNMEEEVSVSRAPSYTTPPPGIMTRRSNIGDLTSQLNKQEQIAAAATAQALMLRSQVNDSRGVAKISSQLESQAETRGVDTTPLTGLIRTPTRIALAADLGVLRNVASNDSTSGISSLTQQGSALQDLSSALNRSKYAGTPHNTIPANDADAPGTASTEGNMYSMQHRVLPGATGHIWILQVGFAYLAEHDSKSTLLYGLSSIMDILPNAVADFKLHPLDDGSTLPFLTNNKVEEGFPQSASLAFQYILVKDKRNRSAQQDTSNLPVAPSPSPFRHNDEEEFKPSTMMSGII